MRETTKQTLAILVITVILGSSIFVFLKFTQPAYANLIELKSAILEKEEIKKDLVEQKKVADEIVGKYLTLGGELGKINKALPRKPELAEVLAALDAIARETKINLNDIAFRELSSSVIEGKGEKITPVKTIEVSFTIDGKFVDTNNFLAEVGKELRLMDVKQVAMEQYNAMVALTGKTKGFKPVELLRTNIVLYTYYQP